MNHVLQLAERGFSYRCISQVTGLTKNHIGYILKQNKTKVSDYRNGKTPLARQVLKRLKIYV